VIPYNHTREDSPLTPCPLCAAMAAAMAKEDRPELRIYWESSRADLPIVVLEEGSEHVIRWSPGAFLPVASVMLNEAATRRGIYIRHLQQCNIIKFEGHAHAVRVHSLQPWEQLLVGLFFGGFGPC
jgi:hypothetical protein